MEPGICRWGILGTAGIARKNWQAMYVPLPTGLRKESVIRAAEAGKHVLAEKPVGVTAADVRDMLAACERNRVQFMDGVMFMHSRLDALRRTLDDRETPHGCLGDIGWYTIRFAPWVMNAPHVLGPGRRRPSRSLLGRRCPPHAGGDGCVRAIGAVGEDGGYGRLPRC